MVQGGAVTLLLVAGRTWPFVWGVCWDCCWPPEDDPPEDDDPPDDAGIVHGGATSAVTLRVSGTRRALVRCCASRTVRTPGVWSAVETGSVEPPEDVTPELLLELLPHAARAMPIAHVAATAAPFRNTDLLKLVISFPRPPLSRSYPIEPGRTPQHLARRVRRRSIVGGDAGEVVQVRFRAARRRGHIGRRGTGCRGGAAQAMGERGARGPVGIPRRTPGQGVVRE